MIIDTLPNKYERLASKHTFRPWQTGLLGDMVSSESKEQIVTINMGRQAGHTYFARIAASKDFPARTKIYVTRADNVKEFAALTFHEDELHEPIELLDRDDFRGYQGSRIDYVIIDMSDEHVRRFKQAIGLIRATVDSETRIVLMQPNFLNFLDQPTILSV